MNMSVQMSPILHGFHVQLRMLVIMLLSISKLNLIKAHTHTHKPTYIVYRKWRWTHGHRAEKKEKKIFVNTNKMPTVQTIYRSIDLSNITQKNKNKLQSNRFGLETLLHRRRLFQWRYQIYSEITMTSFQCRKNEFKVRDTQRTKYGQASMLM